MRSRRAVIATVAAAAALICFVVHLKALTCGFINWDDTEYLLNNQVFRSFDMEMVVRAFTTIPINYWIPLTWISYAVDYRFWGMNPTGYHLTNIIIHSVNAALLVVITDRLFTWRPEFLCGVLPDTPADSGRGLRYGALLLFVALLWGIHPARVESVAWATERKDVLNGFFLLGSLYFYLQYSMLKMQGSDMNVLLRPYLLSLLFFTGSVMSKPLGVVFPPLLFLLDWFPLGRIRRGEVVRILLEKIPYLLLAGGVAAVTIIMGEGQGAYIPLSEFPLSARVVVIGNALFEYVRLLLYPAGIITYYHLPQVIPQSYIYKAAIAFVLLAVSFFFGRGKPWLIATLLAFLIPLLPVLQLFPNGLQPALCTRYTYLPTLLPTIMIVLLIGKGFGRLSAGFPRSAPLLAGGVVILLFYYGMVTQRLIGDWKNSGTFWTRVIETQPFERAYFYRGLYYADEGRFPEAVQDYSSTLDLLAAEHSPEIYNLYAFRGEAFAKAGRYPEALRDFDAAIAMFPHRLYFYHRGEVLQALGRLSEAAEDRARAGRARGQMHWFTPGTALQ